MVRTYLQRILFKLHKMLLQMIPLENASSLYKKGQFEEAYSVLSQVMKKESRLSKNGDAYLLLAELELRVNDNYCKALELLEKAEEFGYLDTRFYYSTHGQTMLGMRDYENAIRDFERCVAIDHRRSDLTMLAQALSMNNDKRALSTWYQVLDKDKNNCLAHAFVGTELEKRGDCGKAFLMAKRAEKLNPGAEEFLCIGNLYHDLEEFQSAIKMYLEADRLGYKHKSFLYAIIAACYISLDQDAQTRTYAQWALQHKPVNDYAKIIWHEYEERYKQKEE